MTAHDLPLCKAQAQQNRCKPVKGDLVFSGIGPQAAKAELARSLFLPFQNRGWPVCEKKRSIPADACEGTPLKSMNCVE